jgi:hypothetical protein
VLALFGMVGQAAEFFPNCFDTLGVRVRNPTTDTPKVHRAVLMRYFSVKSSPNLRKRSGTKSLTFCLYFWQIEPELKKTRWNKISNFLSSLFLVYQFFWPEGDSQTPHLTMKDVVTYIQ